MTLPTILIDTSFIVAASVENDKNHSLARIFIQRERYQSLFPESALSELFVVIQKRSSYQRARNVLSIVELGGVDLVSLEKGDLHRIQQIANQYQDARFDFVDMALMTLAERLNIDTILTFDRRDFAIFRPIHVPYLKLLP